MYVILNLLHLLCSMGRFDKKLKAAKKIKAEKNLSASAVAKTLAVKDKQDSLVKLSTVDLVKKAGPADFKLLLERPTKKAIVAKAAVQHKITKAKPLQNKITKKDKMKLRKDQLKTRLEVMQLIKKEEKASKRRQKKAITGDLKPITDTLDDILAEDDKKKQNEKAPKIHIRPTKQKKIKEQMMKDIAIFQQVTKHPVYSSDPFNTISTHIQNKMLLEAMEN